MKLEVKSFNTKVARRIFGLFVICAIVPISALALVSFSHVKSQLNKQSQERLLQESKSIGVSIYERLLFLETDLKVIASNLDPCFGRPAQTLPEVLAENQKERFSGLALITNEGDHTPLFGHIKDTPELTAVEKEHLNSGKPFLCHRFTPDSLPLLFISVAVDPKHPRRGVLLGKINESYLWEAVDGRTPLTEVCVLDPSNKILYSSLSDLTSFPDQSSKRITFAHAGHFEWRYRSKAYFASYYSIFLKPIFLSSSWTVLLSESEEDILGPMANFRKAFPVIIILSICMVFLLSINLIRKNMGPIEILREATQKISDGAFGHKVEITSGDEFEGLGKSFNEMSKKLKEGQALLVKAAKLSTMGQMAAGVLHEVKQPLTAIYGLLELSLMKAPPDDRSKRIKTALESVKRLNAILERFKSFAHMSEGIMETFSIKLALDQIYNLLEHQFKMKRIRCVIEKEQNLPYILGDQQGLQQVFSNLLINAVHALEDKEDGERLIYIKAYSSEENVFVEIGDNGCGIPEEIRNRIFDPFFTTKSAEKGTGLGMAIIESILHKHHARIGMESEVGVGTRFTIVFPVPHSSSMKNASNLGKA